jgi:hypothetical protein
MAAIGIISSFTLIFKMTEKNILYKILTALTSTGLAVSGWFINQNFARLDHLDKQVADIYLTTTKAEVTQFTNKEWIIAKSILDSEKISTEKRIIRLEESLPVIRESLAEIKASIKELK